VWLIVARQHKFCFFPLILWIMWLQTRHVIEKLLDWENSHLYHKVRISCVWYFTHLILCFHFLSYVLDFLLFTSTTAAVMRSFVILFDILCAVLPYCKCNQPVSLRLGVMIGPNSRKNRLTSGGDSVPDTDSGSLFHFPHQCRMGDWGNDSLWWLVASSVASNSVMNKIQSQGCGEWLPLISAKICVPCSRLGIPPLPLLGHVWDVTLVWRKGNINRTLAVLQYCVPVVRAVLTGRSTVSGFDLA